MGLKRVREPSDFLFKKITSFSVDSEWIRVEMGKFSLIFCLNKKNKEYPYEVFVKL
jgi:hypothetical protein